MVLGPKSSHISRACAVWRRAGFFKPKEQMREDLEWMCVIFVIIAVSCLIGSTVSHGCFSILGEARSELSM